MFVCWYSGPEYEDDDRLEDNVGGGEEELEDDEGVEVGGGGGHQHVRQEAAQGQQWNMFLL